MPIGEPAQWTHARNARLAQRYPVTFGTSSATDVIGTDAYGIAQGAPPTDFGTQAMTLAAHAGKVTNPTPVTAPKKPTDFLSSIGRRMGSTEYHQ